MRKKFLYILTYNEGFGANGFGSAQRSEHLLKAIQQEGVCDVVLLHVGEEKEFNPDLSGVKRILQKDAELVCLHRQSIRTQQLLLYKLVYYAAWRLGFLHAFNIFFPQGGTCFPEVRSRVESGTYDAVVLRYFLPGVRTGLFKGASVPLLIDVDDNPLELVATHAPSLLQKTGLSKIGWLLTRHWMRAGLKRCSYAWWVRDEEVHQFRKECPGSVLQNIPVFPAEKVPYTILRQEQSPLNVLFVGYLSYGPNKAGLLHFLEQVWPQVIQEEPDAELHVVGKGADDELCDVMSRLKGVHYHGFQESLLPFYNACTLAVCPIYQGAGSKIKVLEALAYDRPIVLTEHALEGLKHFFNDSQGVLSASSDAAFSDAIVKLQREPEFAVQVALAGLKQVEKYFSVASFESQVKTGLMAISEQGDL
jgi:glycosyltransferase involved in cell wall biosynthesis